MKYSKFGRDKYAEDSAEVRAIIDDGASDDFYANLLFNSEGDDDGGGDINSRGWYAEILDNETGDAIGYTVSMTDKADVRNMLLNAGFAVKDILEPN